MATTAEDETIEIVLKRHGDASPMFEVARVRRVAPPPPVALRGVEFGCSGSAGGGDDQSWFIVYPQCSDGRSRALRCLGDACSCEGGPSTGDGMADEAARQVERTFPGPLPRPQDSQTAVAFARHNCGWRMQP